MRFVLDVPDISCQHCRMRISKALDEIGVKSYHISVEEKKVELEFYDIDTVLRKLDDIGYPARLRDIKGG